MNALKTILGEVVPLQTSVDPDIVAVSEAVCAKTSLWLHQNTQIKIEKYK